MDTYLLRAFAIAACKAAGITFDPLGLAPFTPLGMIFRYTDPTYTFAILGEQE